MGDDTGSGDEESKGNRKERKDLWRAEVREESRVTVPFTTTLT